MAMVVLIEACRRSFWARLYFYFSMTVRNRPMAQREPAEWLLNTLRSEDAEAQSDGKLSAFSHLDARVWLLASSICVEYGFVWISCGSDGVSPGVELGIWRWDHHNDSVSVRRSDDDLNGLAFGPTTRDLDVAIQHLCPRGVGRAGHVGVCRVGRLLRDCLRRRACMTGPSGQSPANLPERLLRGIALITRLEFGKWTGRMRSGRENAIGQLSNWR